jgi:hypothetical protein
MVGGLTLLNSSGTSQVSVGGTLSVQAGGVVYLGNFFCQSGAGCPGPPAYDGAPITVGPSITSVGTFINRGTVYCWCGINAPSLTNDGTFSAISGGFDVGTLRNAGTIYLANACCSMGIEPTAAVDFSHLDEVLSASKVGTIVYNTWPTGPGTPPDGYPVDLSGVSLHVTLQNGFTPSIGETFTMMTFLPGLLSGTFSQVSWDSFDNGRGYFLVSYNNGGGDVSITAEERSVPEPSAISLAVLAFGLLWWGARQPFCSNRRHAMRRRSCDRAPPHLLRCSLGADQSR